MATRNEEDSTRGRASVLRMMLNGRAADLTDQQVYRVLDLCLECRACRTECPVGVDMARHKSEFLSGYWSRNGVPLAARVLGHARALAEWGARLAPLSNLLASSWPGRWGAQALGIHPSRTLPPFATQTLSQLAPKGCEGTLTAREVAPDVLLFVDTFTEFYEPDAGLASLRLLRAAGRRPGLAPNGCCGRPLISKGFLEEARAAAEQNAERLYRVAEAGTPLVFCEPSCLSAVREDAPDLLRGEARRKAEVVAAASRLLEEFLAGTRLPVRPSDEPRPVVLHGHCHQKSMGLLDPAKRLLASVPAVRITDPDASCCGMAGSFGYTRDHYEVSVKMAERRLLPAVRNRPAGAPVLASGFSCRHQITGLTGVEAMHPAVYLASLLDEPLPETGRGGA
jgi:Fe-S oxidoreductase